MCQQWEWIHKSQWMLTAKSEHIANTWRSTTKSWQIMANELRMQVCPVLFLPSNSSSAIWLTSGLASDLKTITCGLYINHWKTKLEHQFLEDSGGMSVSTTERNLTRNIPIYPIPERRFYWKRERKRERYQMDATTSERGGINQCFCYLASINNITTNTITITITIIIIIIIISRGGSRVGSSSSGRRSSSSSSKAASRSSSLCQLLAPLARFPHCTPIIYIICHVHWTASSNRFRNSGLKKFLSLGSLGRFISSMWAANHCNLIKGKRSNQIHHHKLWMQLRGSSNTSVFKRL